MDYRTEQQLYNVPVAGVVGKVVPGLEDTLVSEAGRPGGCRVAGPETSQIICKLSMACI